MSAEKIVIRIIRKSKVNSVLQVNRVYSTRLSIDVSPRQPFTEPTRDSHLKAVAMVVARDVVQELAERNAGRRDAVPTRSCLPSRH